HTTRDTAAAILHRHRADYLLAVKGNASETYAALRTIDWDHDATASFSEQPSKGHGRIEQRHIHTMKPESGMLNYPRVKQVFRIIRHRHTLKTGVDSNEVAYGITSLSAESADAKRLLALNRGHWTIENLNHRFRDTTFAEDACLMHTRHGPSNNAILNNTALAVIFHRGRHDVAAAVQEFAMDRSQAIRALTEPG
ncbi:MAG: ISAs1 family transposase, partial [Spirochaetaceae bacterium]|nr:ISAs1 family transposase [Spirochaetaceae bacterium]